MGRPQSAGRDNKFPNRMKRGSMGRGTVQVADQEGVSDLLSPVAAVVVPRTPEHIDELLDECLQLGGSDLHLAAGAPPTARVNGQLVPFEGYAVLRADVIERLVFSILDERRIASFNNELELDTSYSIPGKSRFRMNVFRQRGSIGAVLRTIPFHIPDFESLQMPPVIRTFAQLPRGLVLVTGPTGSGKSTTLASLLDIINRTKAVHILSCEDPIEFLYGHKKAIVNQREVGEDTKSFAVGAEARPARRPRRDPCRRDARPGDDPHGADGCRDRAPRLRDVAHPVGSRRPSIGWSTSSRPISRGRSE